MKILKNISQVKQYKTSHQESKQVKQIGQLTPEMIKQIGRDVLGNYA